MRRGRNSFLVKNVCSLIPSFFLVLISTVFLDVNVEGAVSHSKDSVAELSDRKDEMRSTKDAFPSLEQFLMPFAERLVTSVHILVLRDGNSLYIHVGEQIKKPWTEGDRVSLAQLKNKLQEIKRRDPKVNIKSVILSATPDITYRQISKVITAYEKTIGELGSFLPGDVQYILLEPFEPENGK